MVVVRRVVLVLAALIFLGVAIGSLLVPDKMAEPFGYRLDTVNGLSEFRAIYVGLWLAQVVIFVWAAWRVRTVWLGDVCAILIGGQVLGRLLSLVLDGAPDQRLIPMALIEAVGAVALAAARPGQTGRPTR
jgi:hypothetical protein